MKNSAVIVSNSNLFTVFSRSFLSGDYDCRIINVKYANEEMTREEHLDIQIRELANEHARAMGLVSLKKGKHDFEFNDRLAYRLDKAIRDAEPSILFYEMKNFKHADWAFLKHISDTYDIPVVVYIGAADHSDKIVTCLSRMKVKQVVTKLDRDVFESAAKRFSKAR